MKLIESDRVLADVCRSVELCMHSVEEISDLTIPVTLKRDFENLFPDDPIKRTSAAASDVVERQIFINQMPFSQLEREAAAATLAHEIGHIVIARDSLMERPVSRLLPSECTVADRLACKWGFLSGTKKIRIASYAGQVLCDALDSWQDDDEYIRRVRAYQQHVLIRKIAGY